MNGFYGVEEMRGVLFFLLLVATPASLLITLALIGGYRRSVRRGMKRISAKVPVVHPELPPAPPGMAAPVSEVGPIDAVAVTGVLSRVEWSRAFVYTVAGILSALCMTWIFFHINSIGFLPVRFSVVAYVFFWPAILVLSRFDLPRRLWSAMAVGYFLIPLVFPITYFEFLYLWGGYMGIPSFLLLFFALPRFRVVGPVVFVATFFAVWGGLSGIFAFGHGFIVTEGALGAEIPTLIGALAVVAFLVLAWLLLKGVARLYGQHRFSDWQLGVDAWWLLFTLWMGIQLSVEGGALAWTALVPLLVYRAGVAVGLKWIRGGSGRASPLLLLRVFGRPEQSRSLFDRLELRWRDLGPIKLIVSTDLAHQTLEIQELLEYLGGRLDRRFHKAGEPVRVDAGDLKADPDHRFRVQDFLCHADSWRDVLVELLDRSDVIIMDLRGFQARNRGCAFELSQIAQRLPEKQFIGLIDSSTDRGALQETLNAAWVGSGNAPGMAEGFRLFPFGDDTQVDDVISLVQSG